MAKSRPGVDRAKRNKRRLKPHKTELESRSAEDLLTEAAILVQQSQPENALPLAQRALVRLKGHHITSEAQLPALLLLAHIALELGDPSEAHEQYAAAVAVDPKGEKIGAEPFMWLAQLNEEGGQDSISWFQQGLDILKREVCELEQCMPQSKMTEPVFAEKRQKMVDALCGMVEVYMTDLSLDPNAEGRCETMITEALLLNPESPSALQTLANVRISQVRHEEAKLALRRSMDLWMSLPNDEGQIPDFSSRISLSRLLMEVDMEAEALAVLEQLVQEEDQSVEAWYLGGWCQYLRAEKGIDAKDAARDWLRNSLQLYDLQDYEDERLRDHAEELVNCLDSELGVGEMEEDQWEDVADVDVDDETGNIEVEEVDGAL